jgi:hypothetical protein
MIWFSSTITGDMKAGRWTRLADSRQGRRQEFPRLARSGRALNSGWVMHFLVGDTKYA